MNESPDLLPDDDGGGYFACPPYESLSSHGGYPFEAYGYPFQSYGYPEAAAPVPVPAAEAPSRPLRVIHVGPDLLRGGAEQWLVDLVRFLDPKRVRVLRAVVTNPRRVDPRLVAELAVPLETGQAEAVRRAARECDVLLCWGLELNAWLADCRPPLCVFGAHGDGDWTRALLRGSDRVVDHVVAVSQGVKDRCCQGFPTTVIWNGVDSARLGRTRTRQAVREALAFRPEDFVLGYVGRFSPEKRVPAVIEAVARQANGCKALLVGWGAQRLPLLELANERIPGRYAFVTAWEYLGDYYQAMDAVCLVSDQEGFPLVLLEAMMCGRPVIVTPVGCVPEVIQDRVNGVVVAGDPESIAAAAELLRRHPDWARGVADEGRRFAETHGHALRMAREYERLLHRLWTEKYGRLPPAGPAAEGRRP